jgi:hypothetical protein
MFERLHQVAILVSLALLMRPRFVRVPFAMLEGRPASYPFGPRRSAAFHKIGGFLKIRCQQIPLVDFVFDAFLAEGRMHVV